MPEIEPVKKKASIDERDYNKLEETLGYKFNDRYKLEEALTHSSFSHEHGLFYNNERLEFFGDSVLGFVIARSLYKMYPDSGEGELTRMRAELVKSDSLYKKAEILNVPYMLLHGHSMRSENLPRSICADAVESIIGAVCLDGGITSAERVIKKLFLSDLDEQEAKADPKSRLQMWLQKRNLPLPAYELIRVTGPSHNPLFEVRLMINGFEHSASDKTRKGAESKVAELILKDLKAQEVKEIEDAGNNKDSNKKREEIVDESIFDDALFNGE